MLYSASMYRTGAEDQFLRTHAQGGKPVDWIAVDRKLTVNKPLGRANRKRISIALIEPTTWKERSRLYVQGVSFDTEEVSSSDTEEHRCTKERIDTMSTAGVWSSDAESVKL